MLQAFREWAATAPDEATFLAAIMTAPPEPFVPADIVGRKIVALLGCWCGDPAAGTAALTPLRALGPALDHIGPMPYPALQTMLDGAAPAGLRNYFRGGFLADLTDDVIDIALRRGAQLPPPMSQIHFHQMGGAVGRVAGPSAFGGRAAGYTFNLVSTWTATAEDTVHIDATRTLATELTPHAMPGTYVNFAGDAGIGHGGVRAAYGDTTYTRLARLKRQYDPTNLFRRNQNVRPAP